MGIDYKDLNPEWKELQEEKLMKCKVDVKAMNFWVSLAMLMAVFAGCGGGGGGSAAPPQGGSFSLTPEPAVLNSTIPADGVATVGTSVQVVPSGDFTGSVTFTIEGVPDGVTAAFSDPSSTTATSLQLTVDAFAVQCSAILTVTGTSPGVPDATTTVDLTLLTADKLPILATVEEELRQYASQGMTPLEQAQSIAAFMQGRNEYVDAGVDEETLSAWGELQNGRLHVVSTGYFPSKEAPGAPAPLLAGIDSDERSSVLSVSKLPQAVTTLGADRAAAGSGNALPGSSYARLLHSFGTNFEGQDPINDAVGWLKDAGWKIRSGAEGDASLELLKTVKGDGFFYINSHGGQARKSSTNTNFFCVSSSTIQNSALDETYKDDWDNYRIVYYTGKNGETILGGLVDDFETWYGITYAFVEKYMSFSSNSIVWINACHSQGGASSTNAFRFACLQKGAGVYFGWTSTLSSAGAYPAIRYFVDRSLGANKYEPEYPAQRPFPWDLVVPDMTAKGLARGANGEVLVPTPQTPGTPPSLLAPSIRLIEVDEYSYDMKLKGYFGSDQGEVSVGGTPVTVKSWDSEEITCELPKDLSGDVLVKVRGLESNPRPLTQWIVPLSYTWDMTGGFIKWTGTGELRYRLDVSGFREKPGDAPTYLRRGTWPVLEGGITVSVSGNVNPCSITGGTVTLPSLPSDKNPTAFIQAPLIVDANTNTGLLGLAFGANPAPWQLVCPGAPPANLMPSFGKLPLLESYFYQTQEEDAEAEVGPLPAVNVTYGADMALNGGIFTDSTAGTMKVEWKNPTQTSPPRPDDAGI